MNYRTTFLTMTLCLAVLAGCATTQSPISSSSASTPPAEATSIANTAPATQPAAFPLTVEDDSGVEVTLESAPVRIVSLAPGHTEILYALGLGDRVAGVTNYCNYPPEATEKPKVGGFSSIDLEQVVGLEPDLVLATRTHLKETVPALRERGIVVFVSDPQTIAQVLSTTLTIGKLTDSTAAAEVLVNEMQQRIDLVRNAVKDAARPRVFWELGPELYSVGPDTFLNDLIVTAGGENVAADAGTAWPQLSMEQIIAKDPDVVVLADHNYGETAETVAERPGWSEISAVKAGHLVEVTDDDIVSRASPRIVDGLEWLARSLHPDRFP